MLDCLPLEIVYQILAHVPYSEFPILHKALPGHLVELALLGKLKQQQHSQQEESLLKLVSTNRNEMVAPFYKPRIPTSPQLLSNQSLYHYTHHAENNLERSNESSIPLFFKHMDLEHRMVWLAPDIKSTQYYFEVKDFYVSHGKLILRQQRHQALQHSQGKPKEKVLGSLWDIRNKFPSSRSGNFSGVASQGNHLTTLSATSSPSPALTLSPPSSPPSPSYSQFPLFDSPSVHMCLSPQQQPGTFTMSMEADTTTSGNSNTSGSMQQQAMKDEHNNHNNINSSTSPLSPQLNSDSIRSIILDACCVLTLNKGAHGIGATGSNHHQNHSSRLATKDTTLTTTKRYGFPPRPLVPWGYSDQLPMGYIRTFPWDTSFCCGYFVVEQVAVSMSDFLDFL
ncbi:hypothetical protein BCR42DRAFT_423924 [Absidia repens]|uniref:Uncharacterized protein n=1 Tax=Absidia repens TaxID=90262 RepID=A0A1X2I609_9FUNG|nr:hypothetical protein BCR42DRAFT_423924 [Absidia repens]